MNGFGFTLRATDGSARTGFVSTPRGDIRTPAFMPVGTAATVKGLYFDQVKAAGADVVLGNTYHLMLRPGAERVARLGGLHRNTYINSPTLLDPSLALKGRPGLRFAGQITGCEGYVESASIGLLAGRFASAERRGETPSLPPETTAFGALLNHITGGHIVSDDEPGKRSFQPMNVNFGLFPPLEPGTVTKPEGVKRFRGKDKALAKKQATAARALEDCARWLGR